MNNGLNNLTKMYGNKVVDLRTLYGFRLLLKRKIVEYRKVIGDSPSGGQSLQILWNAMDPSSKVIALKQKMDVEPNGYKELSEHIDLRHNIQYGTFDYKASARDDPMGLALMDEHKAIEAPPHSGGVAPELQAGRPAG